MQPFFLPTADDSRLFAVLWPATAAASQQAVLVLPPFGEEMNKCRPMLAAQARAFAAAGLHVLLVDLFGTGDSDGEFGEAQWPRWLRDLQAARAWLIAQKQVNVVHLLAVRSGALFVSALLEEPQPEMRLVLWQPVIKGADVWRQLLRMRMMADSARGQPGSSAELEQRMAQDGSLEIGGYTISAALAAALGAAQLDQPALQRAGHTLWLEVAATDPPALSTGGARICKQWAQGGVQLEGAAIRGEPFWSTPEIGWARALLEPTTVFAARSLATPVLA